MFARPRIELKTREQIRVMRRAGLVVKDALDAVQAAVAPGVTTAELDAIAAGVIAGAGATSNFLGYHGFPATTCISVNDQVVHGIPDGRALAEGDVVSVDCGAVVDGWHGDAARTILVGKADPRDVELSELTRRAMWHGIAALRVGGFVGDVGAAIDDFLADRLGIVEQYTGHGIGTAMHQPPDVLNYRSRSRGPKLKAGICLAIEPMLTAGSPDTHELDDGWTVVTDDGSRAAHWEHSVAVLPDGLFVLTAADGGTAALGELGVRLAEL